ncbi:MAG: DNA repair protein RadC [Nitriliruptoraceae bacterium]
MSARADGMRSADRWRHGRPAGTARLAARCSTCATTLLRPDTERVEITSPDAAAEVLVAAVADADREHCVVAVLDTKHRLLAVAQISAGSLDHTFMAPREVFRDALMRNGAAIVLAHNHPSGDPSPSADDLAVTRRLVDAGRIIGIDVLDHLVVGGGDWVSLARRGELDSRA